MENILTTIENTEELVVKRGDLIATKYGNRIVCTSKDRGICVAVDEGFNLKSRVRNNLTELLDGYNVTSAKPITFDHVIGHTGELDLSDINVGDVILVNSKEGNVYRIIAGGYSYGVSKYFALDPQTMIIKSDLYGSIEELIEKYDVIYKFSLIEECECETEEEEDEEDLW